MSEGVIIALISFASAVVGAAITGFATVVAAGKNQNSVSCGVVGLVASIGAAGGLVLGAFFGVFLLKPENASTPTNNPVISSSSNTLSVQLPNDLSCLQHSSGYCGLTMTVSWSNIESNNGYYIYTVGHGLNYQPEMWWIAGTGVSINTSTGNRVITDGAYGNPRDSLGVFACLTKTKYDFNGRKEILLYEKPDCDMYSTEVYFQPK